VGLVRRHEVIVNAEMDLDGGGTEPAATAQLEMVRLPHSRDAEEARVERLGLGLSARWHRQLDVVDRPDHGNDLTPPGCPRTEHRVDFLGDLSE
jgi:hypothetical protein